jgi:hypothetical protein
MHLLRRHKYSLIALGLYWPLVFTLTHIPVPKWAGQSGMSDKTMHVMAYFALTFLVWCVVSPYQRVQWNSSKTWWVIAAVALYGAVDEVIQGMVGRSADIHDYVANLFGVAFALGLLSVFHFWAALLTASVVSIFVISNLSNLTGLYPQYHLNTLFHFSAYAGLSLIWIQHMERYLHLRQNRALWLLAAPALPLAMLTLVLAVAPFYNKTIWWTDVSTAVFGIIATILISRLTFALTRKHDSRK